MTDTDNNSPLVLGPDEHIYVMDAAAREREADRLTTAPTYEEAAAHVDATMGNGLGAFVLGEDDHILVMDDAAREREAERVTSRLVEVLGDEDAVRAEVDLLADWVTRATAALEVAAAKGDTALVEDLRNRLTDARTLQRLLRGELRERFAQQLLPGRDGE